MRRLIRAAASFSLALIAFAAPAKAQDTQIEKVFGTPGVEGYRVLFDRYGAAVQHVNLLDHESEEIDAEGGRAEYLLVDIYWANPAVPSQGYMSWLSLSEWDQADRRFPDVDLGTASWEVQSDTQDAIVFSLDLGDGLTIDKSYSYQSGRRDLLLEMTLRADGVHPRAGEDLFLGLRGLAVRSPRSDYTLGQNTSRAVGATMMADGTIGFVSGVADGSPNTEVLPPLLSAGEGALIDYAGSTNRFFGSFLLPLDESSRRGLWTATMIEQPFVAQADTPAFSVPVVNYGLRFTIPQDGATNQLAYRLYMGPKSNRVFDANPDYARFTDVVTNDLNPGCFCSIPGQQTMARFLLWLLGKLYDFVGNWGVAIMLLTIIVRGALIPVNFRMQKAMRVYGAKAAKLKPKLDELQKKYANDRKQLQQAMMAFQREHKMFPPIGGCLPMFITIPVFIGLFTALRTSYDLRQQPFIGWITDLSQPDALFEVGLGWMPFFNLLPIIMVGLWWWLQSGTPLPTDPQQRQMMKIMRWMPMMFGVMLYNYASGLMVYMITSSLFALVEQRVTKKLLGPMSAEAGAFATPQI